MYGANPGYGMGGAPPMGFVYPPGGGATGVSGPSHTGYSMPGNDSDPKPYESASGGSSFGDIHGIDFSEKTIRMAFIRWASKLMDEFD